MRRFLNIRRYNNKITRKFHEITRMFIMRKHLNEIIPQNNDSQMNEIVSQNTFLVSQHNVVVFESDDKIMGLQLT